MTKLEIAAYDQMVLAREAEQRAEDLGYALDLLLNDRFERFHTAQTPDGATHDFLSGLADLVPVVSISPRLRSNARIQKIRIILWKTTFGPRNIHGSAYREDEFNMSPRWLGTRAPELKKLLQEAIEKLSAGTPPPNTPTPPHSSLARSSTVQRSP